MNRVEDFILSGPRTHYVNLTQNQPISGKYMDIDLNSDNGIIEIPDFFASSLYEKVYNRIDRVTITLYTSDYHNSRRVVRGALSDFERTFNYNSIQKVRMTSGRVYYGMPGVIFNEQFEVLMMMTFTVRKNLTPEQMREDNQQEIPFTFLSHNCRVSPRVFENQDGIIEKTIIKKIIPFCTSHKVVASEDAVYLPSAWMKFEEPTIKVIISDVDKLFIKKVTPPSTSENLSEFTRNALLKNISYILPQ